MTFDPTLTDEELAEMDEFSCRYSFLRRVQVRRLIAALRASRAEVTELEETLKTAAQNHCGCLNLYWEDDE